METNNKTTNMETQVQSYLQTEVIDLVLDSEALDQWHELVNEMGLVGQTKIAEPKKSPIPYLFMVPSMVATFETLCPREVELKEYNAGPIPLKALELIKLAQRENHFDRIMIRYDDKSPDPVAIGQKGHFSAYANCPELDLKAYYRIPAEKLEAAKERKVSMGFTPENQYLIARWGAEADTLESLAAKARARYVREKGATVSKQIKDLQQELNTLSETATLRFGADADGAVTVNDNLPF